MTDDRDPHTVARQVVDTLAALGISTRAAGRLCPRCARHPIVDPRAETCPWCAPGAATARPNTVSYRDLVTAGAAPTDAAEAWARHHLATPRHTDRLQTAARTAGIPPAVFAAALRAIGGDLIELDNDHLTTQPQDPT